MPDKTYFPEPSSPKLPLIVTLHGARREYIRARDALVPLADDDATACAILAPLFPAGIASGEDLIGYAELVTTMKKSGTGEHGSVLRYDLVLRDMVAEVAQRYPGIDTETFFLAGFSAGGQFAHRYLYLHPDRVVAASIGAPGSITMLDETFEWPLGISALKTSFPHVESVDVEKLRTIDLQVYVGDKDISTKNFEAARAFEAVKQPGNAGRDQRPRTEKAEALVENWRKNGLNVQFDMVPGVAHSSVGCQNVANSFFAAQLRKWWGRES